MPVVTFSRKQVKYKKWTLKKQIVCSTCVSLILVLIFLIASINYQLNYLYLNTSTKLIEELVVIEKNNLIDLG